MSQAEGFAEALLTALPHARTLGIELLGVESASVTLRLPYDSRLVGDPATGVIHGGVVTTLLDTCCGIAAIAGDASALSVATLDLRIDYMRPARPGAALTARAERYHHTRSVAFLRATAWDEDPDTPVASAAGAFMLERGQ